MRILCMLGIIISLLLGGCASDLPSPNDLLTLTSVPEDDKEIHSSANDTNTINSNDDEVNPYRGTFENFHSWKYDVYEIFRGANVIEAQATLDYAQRYEKPNETWGMIAFDCVISVPQYDVKYVWADELNQYYQDAYDLYIIQGEKEFEIADRYRLISLSYNYHQSYQVGDVMNVLHYNDYISDRGISTPFAEMIALSDGKILCLDDLFGVDEDVYRPVLERALRKSKNRFGERYSSDTEYILHYDWAIDHLSDATPLLTPVGLVFIYPTGLVSSMASGPVFLDVPYEELTDLLKPEYCYPK